MNRLLTSVVIAGVANAVALGFAAWIFDDFDVRFGWGVVAAVLVTALSVTLREIVTGTVARFVRGYTIVGGLVLTFVALWITDLAVPRRGFAIDGAWTWVGATVIVWAAGVAFGEIDHRAPAGAPPVSD